MFFVITARNLWVLTATDSHSEDWSRISAKFEALIMVLHLTQVFLDVMLCHRASSSPKDHLTPR
jgi:hypothetical protein